MTVELRSDAPYVLPRGRAPGTTHRTLVALQRGDLKPEELHWLAVAFEHVIYQEPAPQNVAREAAKRLLKDERWMHNFLHRARKRTNDLRHADAPLSTIDELGRYLVETAQVITADDLDP